MSEKMYPIPFDSLMNWVTSEYAQCGDVFGVQTGLGVHDLGLVLILEDVGQVQSADLQARIQRPLLGQQLKYEGAEAAHSALFDRDQGLMLAREAQDQVGVRLRRRGDGAHVDHRLDAVDVTLQLVE